MSCPGSTSIVHATTASLWMLTAFRASQKNLIDPQGKIVKTVVGEEPAFYTLLDETFGKK